MDIKTIQWYLPWPLLQELLAGLRQICLDVGRGE